MPYSATTLPNCPRCGSTKLTLCGESIEYSPEERPSQPLVEREIRTRAFQCECGLGFTRTDRANTGKKSPS
jgi:hypothetical protein